MTDTPVEEQGHIETELSRDLGLVSALAIGVGTMIAAGIFTLSGLAVGYVGSAAIVSFLLAAVVATFTALTYCEFTSIYPQSGEGYLYARKTFAAPLAYIVGWALLLGYTASCGFYIASLGTYFNEFIWHPPFELLAGLIALMALTFLNIKGTKESGTFQVVITGGKVILLIWFIIGGLGHVDAQAVVEKFSNDLVKIGSTAALVFITFFGFSAIAASAGEVKNPTKTIPRAIFISMGVVTLLYTLVVIVIIAANLSSYSESAMGTAATLFLGPVGGLVIVGGALFSMISASNASIMAGSRVALSMSQLGHLPREIGIINARTRTPIVAVLLVGAAIGTFALLLPLEELANFANCVLLFALILVNSALIVHRKKYPDLERPFRVPLVPLLPVLGILANIYLLTQIPDALPLLLAGGSLIVGFVGFLAWKGTQAPEAALPGEASRVALEQSSARQSAFPVLVPLANPRNVPALIDLAASVAKKRDGEVIALRVVVVPEQLPPSMQEAHVQREREVLELARQRCLAHNVPITTLIRIGHSAARAILETARERKAQLTVLGWKGYASTARHILGEISDSVVRNAQTDIMLVKLPSAEQSFKRILLPMAGGEHAVRALEYAVDLSRLEEGSSITLCRVAPPDADEAYVLSQKQALLFERAKIPDVDNVEVKVIRHASVEDGVVEAAEDYDAVVVGAGGQSVSMQILFGNIPENIARRTACPVIVVKRHHAVKQLVGRIMSE